MWWTAVAGAQEPAAVEASGALEALVADGEVLLDPRLLPDVRAEAAGRLAARGDADALWLLRSAAGDRDPVVRLAAVDAALRLSPDEGPDIALRVLVDPDADGATRAEVVERLGAEGTRAAAGALYEVSGDPSVPARIRARAVEVLEERYADLDLGPPRGVVDPLGGVAFVTANTVVGGVLLSSVGAFGTFDGAVVIGAVGGSAIGLGTGVLYASSRPLTLGQGLGYASGVGWGLAYGLWADTAARGAGRWDPYDVSRSPQPAAVWRAVGVGVGAAVGGVAVSRSPDAWDVLEVDAAGYLGSAVAQGLAGTVGYRPPSATGTWTIEGAPDFGYRSEASRWLAGSAIAGASVGTVAGLLLAPRWDLDAEDALFGVVLGGEAAWIGSFAPTALGVEDRDLKGNVRLPWNGAIAAGLAIAELRPVPVHRSALTAWGAVTGNAIGAGIPLLADADPRTVATVMLPVGVAGTVAGYVAEPLLSPSGGDAAMIAVGTAVATAEGLTVGAALADLDVWGEQPVVGLTALAGGVAGVALAGLSPAVDPAPGDMVLLGTGAAWGGWYGALIPIATGGEGSVAGALIPGAAGGVLGLVGAGLIQLPGVGVEPRDTVIPQLAALSGGTVGALGAALASDEPSAVALGAVIGSTVGFGGGATIAALTGDRPGTARIRLPGTWLPFAGPEPGAGGVPVTTFGVRAVGW